jgi:methionyl-tRNA formyltransferase
VLSVYVLARPPADTMLRAMIAVEGHAESVTPACDVALAVNWRDYVPGRVRRQARHGVLVYHPSLLPRHRGPDAIRWAVLGGDRETGGTLFRASGKLDAGPIVAQRPVAIRPGDTPRGLWERDLLPLGVELCREALRLLAATGSLPGTSQDESLATYEGPWPGAA